MIGPMPGGRPPKINKVIDYRRGPDGSPDQSQPITVGDRIIQAVRAGNYIEAAAGQAGVDKKTIYRWLNDGANIAMEYYEGKRPKLKADERRYMEFCHAVTQADSEWEVGTNTQLERLGRGGIPITTTTTKRGLVDGQMRVIEETTKVEHTLPNGQVLEWRLERRHPDRYGRRTVEVTGPDGGPIQGTMEVSVKDEMLAKLAAMGARLRAEEPAEDDDQSD